jgi:hypothetical protein
MKTSSPEFRGPDVVEWHPPLDLPVDRSSCFVEGGVPERVPCNSLPDGVSRVLAAVMATPKMLRLLGGDPDRDALFPVAAERWRDWFQRYLLVDGHWIPVHGVLTGPVGVSVALQGDTGRIAQINCLRLSSSELPPPRISAARAIAIAEAELRERNAAYDPKHPKYDGKPANAKLVATLWPRNAAQFNRLAYEVRVPVEGFQALVDASNGEPLVVDRF